jgi:hypothetical protein
LTLSLCKLDKDLAPVIFVRVPFLSIVFDFVNLSGVVGSRLRRKEPNHPDLPANSTGDVIVMAKLIDMYTHNNNDGSDNQPTNTHTQARTHTESHRHTHTRRAGWKKMESARAHAPHTLGSVD